MRCERIERSRRGLEDPTVRLTSRRSAATRSGLLMRFSSLHRFHTSTPCFRTFRCSGLAMIASCNSISNESSICLGLYRCLGSSPPLQDRCLGFAMDHSAGGTGATSSLAGTRSDDCHQHPRLRRGRYSCLELSSPDSRLSSPATRRPPSCLILKGFSSRDRGN